MSQEVTKILESWLTEIKWNRLTIDASLARILIALDQGILYEEVKTDYEKADSDKHLYIIDFWNSVQKIDNLLPDSQSGWQEVLHVLLTAIYDRFPVLAKHYLILKEQGLLEYLTFFSNDFRGEITEITKVKDIVVIQTTKGFCPFVEGKFSYNVFDTFDKTLVYAIVEKYDSAGSNTVAHKYIYKMLGME